MHLPIFTGLGLLVAHETHNYKKQYQECTHTYYQECSLVDESVIAEVLIFLVI